MRTNTLIEWKQTAWISTHKSRRWNVQGSLKKMWWHSAFWLKAMLSPDISALHHRHATFLWAYLCLHAVVNNFGRITRVWFPKGHNNGSLIRLRLYYTLPIASGTFSTRDALSHYPLHTYVLKKVLFLLYDKYNYIDLIYLVFIRHCYMFRPSTSAHHRVGKWLTKRVKERGLSLQLVSVNLLTNNYNNYSENWIKRDNKLIYGYLHRNPYCSQKDIFKN